MSLLAEIDFEAKARGLGFVVVGGHAVIAHGYPRLTFHLDLLVQKEKRDLWLKLSSALAYTVFHDGGSFLQLQSAERSLPLDLMLVNEQTFSKISAEARTTIIDGVAVKIPVLPHLLAMKVHTLNHGHTHRFLKDLQDVLGLVEINKIELDSPEIRAILSGMAQPTVRQS